MKREATKIAEKKNKITNRAIEYIARIISRIIKTNPTSSKVK